MNDEPCTREEGPAGAGAPPAPAVAPPVDGGNGCCCGG